MSSPGVVLLVYLVVVLRDSHLVGQGCLQPEVVEILEEQPGCVIARVPLRTWQLAKLVQHKIDHSLNARDGVYVFVCCAHVYVCVVCVLCDSCVCVHVYK